MSGSTFGPIVSSAHLADGPFPELSEFEFGLIVVSHANARWMVRAMDAAGYSGFSALDVLVLHTVRHRDKPKKLADICLVLNVEDTHTVNYSVKKLSKVGLVKVGRQGKEKTVEATPEGVTACARYKEVRETLLLEAMQECGIEPEQLGRVSSLLRLMSGQYDQAARAATAF